MSTLIDHGQYESMPVDYYRTSEGKFFGVIYPNDHTVLSIATTTPDDSFVTCCELAFNKVVELTNENQRKVIDFTFCGMRTDVYHNKLTDRYVGRIHSSKSGQNAISLTPPLKTVNDCAKYAFEQIQRTMEFRSKF